MEEEEVDLEEVVDVVIADAVTAEEVAVDEEEATRVKRMFGLL